MPHIASDGFRWEVIFIDETNDGIEVKYGDAKSREIDREILAGVKDYRLKEEQIEAQLRQSFRHYLKNCR